MIHQVKLKNFPIIGERVFNKKGDTLKRVTIVIPAYWKWPSDQNNKKEVYNFDHLTSLDGKGTLGRLFFSLKNLKYKNFEVFRISSGP